MSHDDFTPPDAPTSEQEHDAVADRTCRTCRTCACVFKIEKPRLMPAGANRQEWDAMPAEMYVCRFYPPQLTQTPRGAVIAQGTTNPESVCWQWKAPGTLPGENSPRVDTKI